MNKSSRVVINKAAGDGEGNTIFRLTQIEPQFVSLVTAGANRQRKFQVVKSDEQQSSKDSGEGAPVAGDNVSSGTNGNDATGDIDFADWFAELEMSIADSINEVNVMANVVELSDECLPPGGAPIESAAGDAAAVKELESAKAEIETLKAKIANLSKELKSAMAANTGLKKQLKAADDERTLLKSRVAKLKSNVVGGTTSIVTGKVGKVEKKTDGKSSNRPLWAAGGDMSAAIEE